MKRAYSSPEASVFDSAGADDRRRAALDGLAGVGTSAGQYFELELAANPADQARALASGSRRQAARDPVIEKLQG